MVFPDGMFGLRHHWPCQNGDLVGVEFFDAKLCHFRGWHWCPSWNCQFSIAEAIFLHDFASHCSFGEVNEIKSHTKTM